MIHGTREDAAFRVMEGGFGTVAGLDDGYYGRGMYFTSDLRYANMYAKEIDAKSQPGVKVFLIAAVLPGNTYPVTEQPFVSEKEGGKGMRKLNPLGLLGQACKAGYQSHYTVVDSVSVNLAFPTQLDDFDDPKKKRVVSDELVAFEGAQALPSSWFTPRNPLSSQAPEAAPRDLQQPLVFLLEVMWRW